MSRRKDNVTDSEFKNIVRNANILAAILGRYIDDFRDMAPQDIRKYLDVGKRATYVRERNTERRTPMDPLHMDAVFDVKVPNGNDDNVRIIVNIEGQNRISTHYPMENRIQYYVSELICSQKGTYFDGQSYGDINRVYSIWFMMDPLRSYRNTVIRYRMVGEYIGNDPGVAIPEMNLVNVIVINLGEYDSEMDGANSFPALLFNKGMGFEQWKEEMKQRFNVEVNQSLYNRVRKMVSIFEDSKERYFEEGAEEGFRKGTEEGFRKGTAAEHATTISSLADHIMNVSARDGISVDKLLNGLYDDLRLEVEAEIRRRTTS